MNVCISHQSLLEPGSWICFAVHTNCWGVGSNVECVDIFASQALIQKARNWKHLGVVIVEFQQESCTFHKSMWHFFLYVWCFEVMKNTMYFHTLSYSLNQLFLGAQFTEKHFFWQTVTVKDTHTEREGFYAWLIKLDIQSQSKQDVATIKFFYTGLD